MNSHTVIVYMLDDKIQNTGKFLFRFPSEAMLWIKEVEIVDSVDELKSSRSIAGKNFPNFEMLDAKIASALNKIIQNSYFKKKRSVWSNRKLRKRIGSFVEDRSLT